MAIDACVQVAYFTLATRAATAISPVSAAAHGCACAMREQSGIA
jgi:hypothetical protein